MSHKRPKRHTNTLIIFVKLPQPGRVKTRLITDLGIMCACRVYRLLTQHILKVLTPSPHWRTLIAITPYPSSWHTWPKTQNHINQGYGNLSQRLIRCLKLCAKPYSLVIGSDIPNITQTLVKKTFSLLKSSRFVIGPSHDGGYWCIGWRRGVWPSQALKAVRWSSKYTLKDTIKSLGTNTPITYTQSLNDIDTLQDLIQSSKNTKS